MVDSAGGGLDSRFVGLLRQTLVAWSVVLAGSWLVGCADDTVTGVGMSDSASGGTSSTTDITPATITLDDTVGTGVATMAGTGTDTGIDPDSTGTDTATDTDTDTSTDTDTGEPVEPGRAGGAFVNSGSHEGTSPGYRLIFTFGQSTQNQDTMASPGYRLRGGLVPATQ